MLNTMIGNPQMQNKKDVIKYCVGRKENIYFFKNVQPSVIFISITFNIMSVRVRNTMDKDQNMLHFMKDPDQKKEPKRQNL